MFYFSSFLLNLAVILLSFGFLLYQWMKFRYGYWERKGVFSPPAKFPLGHLAPVILQEKQIGIFAKDMYDQFKKHPFIGLVMLYRKTIIVNDLDLVRNVLFKEASYFEGHGFQTNSEKNPLLQNLFSAHGEEWKNLRSKITPSFTPNKMKYMFETMLECTDDLMNYIKSNTNSKRVYEMKEIMAKYTTDVIGSCAFGIKMDSFKHPNAQFRNAGRNLFAPGKMKSFFETLSVVAPSLVNILRIKYFDDEIMDFFTNIVPETIKKREDSNVERKDFLQLMMGLQNKNAKPGQGLNMTEITAQVFLFFGAGFETSSATASFALLEIAKNPDVQEKVREEIEREVIQNGNGKINYEVLNNMSYLNRVIEETLRIYPPLPFLFRYCTKKYPFPQSRTTIDEGTLVIIPILGIQRDPELFQDPLKFDPDRFIPENKIKRHPFSYIPFGEGPRICLGSRFGMQQVKLAVLRILMDFDISVCNETIQPLKYESKTFLLHTQGGLNLQLSPRVANDQN